MVSLASHFRSLSSTPRFRYLPQGQKGLYTSGGEWYGVISLRISVIPVVVAKCGLYLKENATEVEGTFRISGSAKRMRDLQSIFDTSPKVCSWPALARLTVSMARV